MRVLAASILLAGCSATQRVSENSNEIRSEARFLSTHGEQVGDKEVVARADRIYDLAAGIHDQLPGLEDRTPAWMETLVWVAVAVVAVAACVMLWQTGLGQAIRIAIGWIPRKKERDADLAYRMLDEKSPEDAREYVAARRASDPEFDAAWRRIHKKESK
jgi:outer membrane murein-binding lipoprotein Lpp